VLILIFLDTGLAPLERLFWWVATLGASTLGNVAGPPNSLRIPLIRPIELKCHRASNLGAVCLHQEYPLASLKVGVLNLLAPDYLTRAVEFNAIEH
jgi:hypothetical protein